MLQPDSRLYTIKIVVVALATFALDILRLPFAGTEQHRRPVSIQTKKEDKDPKDS